MRTTTRGAANQLAELTIEQPVLTTRFVEERVGITRPAALKALRHLEDVGILVLSVLSDGM